MPIQIERETIYTFLINGKDLAQWCYDKEADDFMDTYLQKVMEDRDRWDSMEECLREEIDQVQNALETTECYDEETGEYIDGSAYTKMEQIRLLKALLKEVK